MRGWSHGLDGCRVAAMTRWSSCGRSSRRVAGLVAKASRVRRRGGRPPRWLRVLGIAQGRSEGVGARDDVGQGPAAQGVLQGPAGILRRSCAGRPHDRRVGRAWTDLRAQAQAVSEDVRSPPRRRDVDLSRWCPHRGALDQVPAGEGLDVAEQLRDFLAAKGISTDGEQQTKTKTALEFFSKELHPN